MSEEAKKPAYAMSTGRHKAVLGLSLLLALVLVWLDHSGLRHSRNYHGEPEEQAGIGDLEKYHARTFTVVNIVDGDTIDINIPDGKDRHSRIRLWGIDTPETKNPKVPAAYFGPEAAEFTAGLVLGKPVTVYLDEQNRTRGYYGRLLAYVQLPDDSFLNELLLTEGFAYADLRFRHSFYHRYKQLEAAARSQKKGLWEKVTHEQLPDWLKKRRLLQHHYTSR